MTKKPKSQSAKFRETARKLECDEDANRFDRVLKRIAKTPTRARESKPAPEQSSER
jgi:hypothetical protein